MFDLDLSKTILFCAVALIVVGPRELPVAMRFLGRSLRRLGQMKTRFRSEWAKVLSEADVEGASEQLKSVGDLTGIDPSYHPATAMRSRPARPNAIRVSATSNDTDAEPTYASPEMARYLGASAETELAPPSVDDVVEFEDNSNERPQIDSEIVASG